MIKPAVLISLVVGFISVLALALTHTGEIRARAEAGLGRGVPEREAALARGFVLGKDEGIDGETEEQFRRAGLSHLLAVSGQNVALLALLAMPILAGFGIALRLRLVWVLGLIAVYVPLAGAGPSIQRAGVMGALGVIATLAGRPASRLYALAIAATVTLAAEPSIGSDVGWQLSFAAVLGILALAAPLRAELGARMSGLGFAGRTLAEGAALTVSATLATAPLIAFHFGELSTVTLLANLLVLPAVAPAMWLGMLGAAMAQVPGLPTEPVNLGAAVLLSYIAEVASWCAGPKWSSLDVAIGPGGLIASYLGFAALAWGVRTGARRAVWPSLVVAVLLSASALLLAGARSVPPAPVDGLRISFLDVGQGDAILLQPGAAPPVLVDGGPPGAGLVGLLHDAGVERLGAAIVTHDQSDHAAGISEAIGEIPIGRLLFARIGRSTVAAARAAGVSPRQVAAGQALRSGGLQLSILWPPRALLGEPLAGADPNGQALVILARWRQFSLLLSADAETETTPLPPGPVDVLKVAHHGSDDAGLPKLLERERPRLAVISVGAGNSYGHPTAATLETLARHGVRVLRTDRDGTVVIEVDEDVISVGSG
jgi:competence protein ComEC